MACQELKQDMYTEWGNSINRYALDYSVCIEDDNSTLFQQQATIRRASSQALHLMSQVGPPFLPDEDKYHPCEEIHLINYLNREDVQTALHTMADVTWTICANGILNYSKRDHVTPQTDLYKQLIDMGVRNEHSLNMFIYSGDDDSVCSTAGTQEWINELGVSPIDRHQWKVWKRYGRFDNKLLGS